MPKTYTVPPPPPHNEGRTVAAWTLTVGVVIGAIVLCLGLVFASMLAVGVGAGVIVLTLVLSVVLKSMGMGQKRTNSEIIAS